MYGRESSVCACMQNSCAMQIKSVLVTRISSVVYIERVSFLEN